MFIVIIYIKIADPNVFRSVRDHRQGVSTSNNRV
jgi:hypothetical protein